MSGLSMLFASAVAIYGFYEVLGLSLFCSEPERRGANIVSGLVVALCGGLAVPVLILFVRSWRFSLAAVLLLGAATLSVAISLVALDSATYVQDNSSCGFFGAGAGTSVGHFGYLYVLWGLPLGLVLIGAGRVFGKSWRPSEPRRGKEPPVSKYDRPGWSQQPPGRGQKAGPGA
jgi:hypothetical protein